MDANFSFMQDIFSQAGIGGLLAFAGYKTVTKLYADMREDSKRREENMQIEVRERLKESKEREEKLMLHLDKQSDQLERQVEINERVAITLDKMDLRINNLEAFCREQKGE